jgi:hypothetical protein
MAHYALLRRACLPALVFSVGCGRSSPPSGPANVPAGVSSPAPTPVPSAIAEPSPSAAPGIAGGSFRFTPDAGPDDVIKLVKGDRIAINATAFAAANPALTLRLGVDWGDGESAHVGCGTCRLEHAYGQEGKFKLEATVDDGQPAGRARSASAVTRTAVVQVVGPSPAPPKPTPAPTPGPTPTPNAGCTYPIPMPVWVAPTPGSTVSGTVTIECALPAGYPASCLEFMDIIASSGSVFFGRGVRGPRYTLAWDTRPFPNGIAHVECAGGPQSAFAREITVNVRN